jgi:hypothetical protein
MSTKDLGVWKAEDCALVLIDYQDNMFEVIRSQRPPPGEDGSRLRDADPSSPEPAHQPALGGAIGKEKT